MRVSSVATDDPAQEDYVVGGLSYETHWLTVADGSMLRYLWFRPAINRQLPLIVLIPGWLSLLNSWRHFLPVVTRECELLYLETREKRSSRLVHEADLSVDAISNDIRQFLSSSHFKGRPYILAGSSIGGTAILQTLCHELAERPLGLYLITPNISPTLPWYTCLLRVLPSFLLPRMQGIIQYVMIKTRIDPADKGHQDRFVAALKAADPHKLKRSALALHGFRLKINRLYRIEVPCLVISASGDREHDHRDVLAISSALPNADRLDLGTFTASHSRRGARALLGFLEQCQRCWPFEDERTRYLSNEQG